jgi:hypothetical protein
MKEKIISFVRNTRAREERDRLRIQKISEMSK